MMTMAIRSELPCIDGWKVEVKNMPEITDCGDFVADPNYDKKSDVLYSIQKLRIELDKELACVDAIHDPTMQLVCMFSLLDSMAQEWADYPTGDSRETFCEFVLEHQSQYDYLDKVEPVTLYYRVEELIDESVAIPGFPPEKEVSLDSLGSVDMCLARNCLFSKKAEEILAYIAKKKGTAYAEHKAKEHRLITPPGYCGISSDAGVEPSNPTVRWTVGQPVGAAPCGRLFAFLSCTVPCWRAGSSRPTGCHCFAP